MIKFTAPNIYRYSQWHEMSSSDEGFNGNSVEAFIVRTV